MQSLVTIGGGTGSFSLLTGLKKYSIRLSAIVAMADDGGSTGVLRDELGVLPPGDIRQCLTALSESSETMRKLFTYRFDQGAFRGHSFGNLFLSALEKVNGNFEDAIADAARILNVRGEVIPITTNDTRLIVQLGNGKEIEGEHRISTNTSIQKMTVKKMYFKPRVRANPRALQAIRTADIVVIGPGNHYSSIIPNLVVPGIPQALRTTRATIIYVCGLSNKKGHTEGYTAVDYINDLHRHVGHAFIDFAIVNTAKPQRRLMKKYERHEGKNVLVTLGQLPTHRTYKVITGSFLSRRIVRHERGDAIAHLRSFIRHDSDKLAQVIIDIVRMPNYRRIMKRMQ